MISQIVAVSENGVIGNNGALPWSVPEDLKFFKEKTKGHVCIMGRKTFETLGKPLPNRLSVIVTRQKNYRAPEGVIVYQNLDQAIEFAKTQKDKYGEEIFICGGSEIYNLAMNKTDRIYITRIKGTFEGDTKYPEINSNAFQLLENKKSDLCTFQTFQRIKK